jgi:hypothetical protein
MDDVWFLKKWKGKTLYAKTDIVLELVAPIDRLCLAPTLFQLCV